MALVWAAMACAVLAKGLVGIVLPGLALVVYAAIERDVSILRSAFTLRGIVVFLAITLPWFILVQRANPEFFDLFFVQEHFRRYLEPGTTGRARGGISCPSWRWPAAMDGRAARRAARRVAGAPPGNAPGRAVAADLGGRRHRVLQRSRSSKLPFYILPALPALAWLFALASPERRPKIAASAAIASVLAGAR